MDLKTKQRISLSIYFFFSGFCFSTWASRIPTIKTYFDFNEAELGSILLAMPISSLIGLPISGWLVSRFDSRVPLLVSFILFSVSLLLIGYATSVFALVIAISIFSFCMRILNIAMNTQSITLQKKYEKRIIGSFHGIWSTGGLAGVGFSTFMVKMNINISQHLLYVAIFTFFASIFAYWFLIKNDRSTTGNKLIIGKPDKFILYLGILVFFAAVCEGGMYDWSGVYFKEVIGEDIFTYGYLIFMAVMAISRFFSDRIIERIGMKKTYVLSASFVSIGIGMAVIFPTFWMAMTGFCLVGFGVSSVFPMTFALAGTSKKYSPGMAISLITTYGIAGMLIGPPLIGYLAHAFNLKISFITFIISGLMLIPFSQLFFKLQKTLD